MLRSTAVRAGVIALLAGLLLIAGCQPKRPYGVERLGRLEDLQAPENNLSQLNLLLRRDADGLSIMSTLCTKDLSQLVMRVEGSRCELVSPRNGSRYDCRGKVLAGPARHDLPYYELFVAPGEYETSKPDTLYAWIGKEKPPSWRLKIN